MPDEKPSLQIDTDWKKQAQEEKRKLAEQAKAAAPAPKAAAPSAAPAAAAPSRATSAPRAQAPREADFATLVDSIATQALYVMAELQSPGANASQILDMARQQIDLLGVLEEKTRNNLTPDEQKSLDATLYQVRMQFVQIASRYSM